MDLKGLVEYIAKSLVEDPSQVKVDVIESANSITLELRVAQGDMGRVIGKEGRIINSIRDMLKILAVKQNKYVDITLAE